MARFNADIDNGLIQAMEKMGERSEEVLGRMVDAGADVALRHIRSNMRGSFQSVRSLEAGLGKTRVFKTPSDDGIAVKVGFRGYSPTRKGSAGAKKFNNSPIPVPFIAVSREKGTARGERKKPFFKKSFVKSEIEAAMKAVEPQLFEGVK